MKKLDDGQFELETDGGTVFHSKVVVIAAGGGSFQPKKPPIPGIDAYEGTSVFYSVKKMEALRGKDMLIVGGGDSALDWTHQPAAAGQEPDAAAPPRRFPRRTRQREEDARAGGGRERWPFKLGQVTGLKGEDGVLSAATVKGNDGASFDVATNAMLPFFGLTMKLGPVADWGLNLHENLLPVDTAKFETSEPGIFAIGDINTYPGKLKLILSGFHEAALMAQQVFQYQEPGRAPAVPVHDLELEPAEEARSFVSILYVTLGTNDVARAKRFYDAALATLGFTCRVSDERRDGLCSRCIGQRAARNACFGSKGRFSDIPPPGAMARWWRCRLRHASRCATFMRRHCAKAVPMTARPGFGAIIENFYACYVRDPDGNKLSAVCEAAE